MTPTGPADETPPWPAEMTRATGRQIQRCRTDPSRAERMSAEQLAQGVTRLGLPYTRAQVTNLEAGRRTTVTIGEIQAIAAVLEVAPLLLILPIGAERTTEFLPGQTGDTWETVRWFTGEAPWPDWGYETGLKTLVPGWRQRYRRFSRPIALFRQHQRAVEAWAEALQAQVEINEEMRTTPGIDTTAAQRSLDTHQTNIDRMEDLISSTRENMRELGLTPPELPYLLRHREDMQ